MPTSPGMAKVTLKSPAASAVAERGVPATLTETEAPTRGVESEESATFPLMTTVSPGEYELEVGMYLWPEMRRLDVLGDDGQVVGDRVLLGAVEVAGSGE